MLTSGPGIYFDGLTTARHPVSVELGEKALRVRAAGGAVLAEWAYDRIEALSAPEHLLRIGKAGNPVLARLEVRDPDLAAAIDAVSLPIDRSGRGERRFRRRIVLWSMAAVASLILVGAVGLPLIATRLTALVSYGLERKLGQAIDAQVHAALDNRRLGAGFECGHGDSAGAANAAFGKLMQQLEAAAALPQRFDASVVRRPEANAIALPGGRIYVFEGLIGEAGSPDELAGVISHEIGHVARRDGTQSIIEGAGLSVLFGLLLGDFVGGGAVVLAATTILKTSYSRQAEAAADAYGVRLMAILGGDMRALGRILLRIAGATHPGPRILVDHPETRQRVAAIDALAALTPSAPSRALLDPAEWAALKSICVRS
ncbi:MAG TPA: M48 family metallopeptidase [Xanthobacteraceae bacterium]|jgi:Zn-dependent protease with chaperone function